MNDTWYIEYTCGPGRTNFWRTRKMGRIYDRFMDRFIPLMHVRFQGDWTVSLSRMAHRYKSVCKLYPTLPWAAAMACGSGIAPSHRLASGPSAHRIIYALFSDIRLSSIVSIHFTILVRRSYEFTQVRTIKKGVNL